MSSWEPRVPITSWCPLKGYNFQLISGLKIPRQPSPRYNWRLLLAFRGRFGQDADVTQGDMLRGGRRPGGLVTVYFRSQIKGGVKKLHRFDFLASFWNVNQIVLFVCWNNLKYLWSDPYESFVYNMRIFSAFCWIIQAIPKKIWYKSQKWEDIIMVMNWPWLISAKPNSHWSQWQSPSWVSPKIPPMFTYT